MKALLIYSSHDGQTKKIMDAIIERVKPHMYCDLVNIKDIKGTYINYSGYHAVCIGSSIRYGFYSFKLRDFINKNFILLNRQKTAFFGVNLVARKPEKNTPETNGYTRKFLDSVLWRPNLKAVFAGALHYPQYGWLDKMLIKLIMTMTKGETDTTKDVEYTDWKAVDEFADKFLELASSSPAQDFDKLYE